MTFTLQSHPEIPLTAESDLDDWAKLFRRAMPNSPIRVFWILDRTENKKISSVQSETGYSPDVLFETARTFLIWFEGLNLSWRVLEPTFSSKPKGTLSGSSTFEVTVLPITSLPLKLENVTERPIKSKVWKPNHGDNFYWKGEIAFPFLKVIEDEQDMKYQVYVRGNCKRLL